MVSFAESCRLEGVGFKDSNRTQKALGYSRFIIEKVAHPYLFPPRIPAYPGIPEGTLDCNLHAWRISSENW